MTISTISDPIVGTITIKEGKRHARYSTGAISYEPRIVCGDCGNFAAHHNDAYRIKHPYVCYRNQYEVGDRYAQRITSDGDYPTFDTLDGIPLTSYSGPTPTKEFDHWATESEISDGYDGRYNDLDPNEQTVTLSEYRKGQRPTVTVIPSQQAFVEGQSGYLIAEYYNPELTEKYALRVLNAFKSNGQQRVGSIAITNNTDGTITAKCVKCSSTMTINPAVIEPELLRGHMEEFTLSVIRHGNNHAAKWFTSRPEFYKVHEQHCDLNSCDPTKAGCNNEVTEAHIKALADLFNTPKERVA